MAETFLEGGATIPKITVSIPTYNAAKYIVETLNSVKRQSVKPFEVIVVDDGSTDGTVGVVEKWIKSNNYLVKIYPQTTNGGIGVARQRCLEYATGDYVAFLSADDCYDRRFLEKSQPFLNGVTATYTTYYRCDKNLFVKSVFRPPAFSRGSVIGWALEKNMYVNFSSIIIPRQLGVGFEESLRHGEDLIFLLDTLLAGLNWHLIDEPLVYYRIHNLMGSVTQHPREFEELWTYLKDRLSLLGIHKNVVDKAYVASRKNAFPNLPNRIIRKVYRTVKPLFTR